MKFRIIRQESTGTMLTKIKKLDNPIYWPEMLDGDTWVNVGPSSGCLSHDEAVHCCADRAASDVRYLLTDNDYDNTI